MPETATLTSVEEYLSTSYKPACDFIDGVLRQKSMPAKKHSRVQFRIGVLIERDYPRFESYPELTMRIRAGKYLVPDLAVMEHAAGGDPYPTEPVYLCVEAMSPGDRMGQAIAKCEEYHDWGVQYTWIVDPVEKRAWEYHGGRQLAEVTETLSAGEISVSCAEVFSLARS